MARALDHVSERWTLLIVRNLMLGPRRYSDLMTELPGIDSTNLLAARLRAMEASGLIAKRAGPPARYELTALGAALEPVIRRRAGTWFTGCIDQPQHRAPRRPTPAGGCSRSSAAIGAACARSLGSSWASGTSS